MKMVLDVHGNVGKILSKLTYSFLISSSDSTCTGAGPFTATAAVASFPLAFGAGEAFPPFAAGFFPTAGPFCK